MAVRIGTAVVARGDGFGDIAPDFVFVLGYSVSMLTLGVLAFWRRMAE